MLKRSEHLDTRDGCRLVYEVSGDGPPLILIHGWTTDREIWFSQVPEFARHYKTITYDRRGYGESDGIPNLRKDLDDLSDLLSHLDIHSTSVLGMSQGGRIALRFSTLYPDKVNALILQCAPLDGYAAQGDEKDLIPLKQYSDLIKQGDINTFREQWMNHPMMHIPSSKSKLKEKLREIINRYSGEDLLTDMTEQFKSPINVAENLNKIKAPTLIIEGDKETSLLKDVANKLTAGIQGSTKVLIKGGGHLINIIEPKKYNAAVISFLKKVSD